MGNLHPVNDTKNYIENNFKEIVKYGETHFRKILIVGATCVGGLIFRNEFEHWYRIYWASEQYKRENGAKKLLETTKIEEEADYIAIHFSSSSEIPDLSDMLFDLDKTFYKIELYNTENEISVSESEFKNILENSLDSIEEFQHLIPKNLLKTYKK